MRFRWLAYTFVAFGTACGGQTLDADDDRGEAGPGSPNAATTPFPARQPACGEARVDQSLVVEGGSGTVSAEGPNRNAEGTLGQSIFVTRDGVLAGIEVPFAECDETPVTMHLYRYPELRRIASVTQPGAHLCGSATLTPSTPGSGYFDFSSQCISVRDGEELAFLLTSPGGEHIVVRQFSGNAYGGTWLRWFDGTLDAPVFGENGGSDTLFQSWVSTLDDAEACRGCGF